MLISPDRSQFLMIDVQDRLAAAMPEREQIVRNCAVLLKAANELGVPVMASEQYPQGLGHTVAELSALTKPEERLEKVEFSCVQNESAGGPAEAARARPDRDRRGRGACLRAADGVRCAFARQRGIRRGGRRGFAAGDEQGACFAPAGGRRGERRHDGDGGVRMAAERFGPGLQGTEQADPLIYFAGICRLQPGAPPGGRPTTRSTSVRNPLRDRIVQ